MTQPVLRVVDTDATPQEVAAILAAVGALVAQSGDPGDDTGASDELREWVHSARLQSRRASMQRGPWRLSGRIGRRTRA